jgi:hypothetical protein
MDRVLLSTLKDEFSGEKKHFVLKPISPRDDISRKQYHETGYYPAPVNK